MEAMIRTGAVTGPLLDRDFAARFAGQDANWHLLSSLNLDRVFAGSDRVAKAMYLWNKGPLADYILSAVGDRPEMANSVESRLPYLDHVLVEMVDRLPTSYKIRDGMEKHVLREAIRGLVPEPLRVRKKKPFFAPPALRDPGSRLNQLLHDTLAGPLPDFLDRRAIERFVAALPPIAPGRFLVYTNERDRKILEADLCLMFIVSMCVLGSTFRLTAGRGNAP